MTLRLWDYEATRAKARSKKHGEYDLPGQHLGYSTLLKLAAMSIAAPKGEDRAIWEPVLSQGPGAHYALQHFIRSLFQRLGKDDDPVAFERVWRAMAEYGVAADWNQPYLWYHGERLICDLLGFGNEEALSLLQSDVALRMKDLYKGWAATHLSREEECVTRFCRFLTSDFGAPLRFDGLCWIASMLKDHKPSSHWYHKGMGDALLELVAETLASGSQALAKKAQARQAVIEIAAELAAMNVSGALALQERIKLLR
ncbi:hypothetical protein D3C76_485980 [compost metagenome]